MGDNANHSWAWHNTEVGKGYQARGVFRQPGVAASAAPTPTPTEGPKNIGMVKLASSRTADAVVKESSTHSVDTRKEKRSKSSRHDESDDSDRHDKRHKSSSHKINHGSSHHKSQKKNRKESKESKHHRREKNSHERHKHDRHGNNSEPPKVHKDKTASNFNPLLQLFATRICDNPNRF